MHQATVLRAWLVTLAKPGDTSRFQQSVSGFLVSLFRRAGSVSQHSHTRTIHRLGYRPEEVVPLVQRCSVWSLLGHLLEAVHCGVAEPKLS